MPRRQSLVHSARPRKSRSRSLSAQRAVPSDLQSLRSLDALRVTRNHRSTPRQVSPAICLKLTAANKNHSLRRMGGRIPTRKAEIDASSPSSSATLVNERSQSIHDHNAERTSWRNSKFLSPPATYTPLAPEAPSGPPRMTKPSSTSLREKARALFSHDEKVLAAKTLPRARGRASVDIDTQTPRPSTPGGYSVFSRERKGLLKLFRRG